MSSTPWEARLCVEYVSGNFWGIHLYVYYVARIPRSTWSEVAAALFPHLPPTLFRIYRRPLAPAADPQKHVFFVVGGGGGLAGEGVVVEVEPLLVRLQEIPAAHKEPGSPAPVVGEEVVLDLVENRCPTRNRGRGGMWMLTNSMAESPSMWSRMA